MWLLQIRLPGYSMRLCYAHCHAVQHINNTPTYTASAIAYTFAAALEPQRQPPAAPLASGALAEAADSCLQRTIARSAACVQQLTAAAKTQQCARMPVSLVHHFTIQALQQLCGTRHIINVQRV